MGLFFMQCYFDLTPIFKLNCKFAFHFQQAARSVISVMNKEVLKRLLLGIRKRFVSTSCRFGKKMKIIRGKPDLSEEELARRFIDNKHIKVIGGKGGDGRSSFLRDKNSAFGGPDGGNGGNGGNVIFVADQNVKSLEKILSVYTAENGVDGGGTNCYGRYGKHLHIKFPVGTYFRSESGVLIADIKQHGEEFVAAYGGLGGKGNRFYVSNTCTTPEECTPGMDGEKKILIAELRTLAHAGLIGFPNAGKSTLLRILTRAHPLVAEYQFTTLRPHIGMLHFEDYTQISIADIPGIIEGAHENKGLGFQFLRHIERCRFLIFIIDVSHPQPWKQFETLKYELSQYNEGLARRPSIVVANKLDLHEAKRNLPMFRQKLETEFNNLRVVAISGKWGSNLEELIHTIRDFYDEDVKTNEPLGETSSIPWR